MGLRQAVRSAAAARREVRWAMTRRKRKADDFDSPWKDALHRYLRSFLAFFFANIESEIDWQHGYESLDKEFQQISRRAKLGKRFADKLFKVWLNDGSERWLLIHIEIQSDHDYAFARRMFDYNVSIYRLYNREVVSLAVLCDDRPEWRPTSFSYERWGCRVEFTFPSAKLLDQRANISALEASSNLFATVVLAHLRALETKNDFGSRREWKLRIVKGLYDRNWSKDDVRELFRLIDWIMTLPDPLEQSFRLEIHEFEKEKQMQYMSSIERHGFEKGLLEGIAVALNAKFGTAGDRLARKLRSLKDVEDLRKFGDFLKTATSLDEVRGYFK